MNNPQITCYAQTIEQAKQALDCGADHIIWEHADFSIRNLQSPSPPLATIENDLQKIMNQFPRAHLSFSIDIVIRQQHFKSIKELLTVLKKTQIKSIFLQNIGLADYIKNDWPQITIIYQPEIGNHNTESFKMLSQSCDGFIFSNELPAKEIAEISSGLAKPLSFGLQVHGPLLIQSSARPYLGKNEIVFTEAEDTQFPQRKVDFINNQHGHHMFLYFDRCLLKHHQLLKDLKLDFWIVDGRHRPEEAVKQAIKAFVSARDSAPTMSTGALEALNTKPLKPGFFLANLTDQELNKIERKAKKENLVDEVAIILDYKKNAWIVTQIIDILDTTHPFRVLNREGKLSQLEPLELRDMSGENISQAQGPDLIKVKWQKGMGPRAKFFR